MKIDVFVCSLGRQVLKPEMFSSNFCQVLHTSRRCFGIHNCFYFSASLLEGIQIQYGIRHIEIEWPAFELNLNDSGFHKESIQEKGIEIVIIVLFIMFWIGFFWKEHNFRKGSQISNLTACLHMTRCQIWCTIELHRDPISKVLLEW